MKNNEGKREGFSSGVAVFFATLGSAVGLGNIWKFPYVVGQNGGGAFLLIYIVCIAFVGIPVMVSEFYLGRKTRKNAVGAFEELKPGSKWKSIGFMGIASAYLIMFFYSCVAGWVYLYTFKVIKGDFNSVTPELAKQQFERTVTGVGGPILWQVIVLTVVSTILILGVKKGIEKVTKTLMPVLFILIVIVGIRAVTLEGAGEGLKFLFGIDFSKITAPVIITAMGLSFFKLSLGMGTMLTYASYFTDDNKMMNTAVKVALSDTLVSLLAGIAIFPAVFSFGMEPGAGPGLLFMTIPMVFSKIYMGRILLPAFFILSSIAATTAMISIVEVLVAYFSEEKGMKRTKAVIMNALIILVIGSLAALSADKGSVLGNAKVFGYTFFGLFDYISSNILLPLGGLLISIFIGYVVKKQDVKYELSNKGNFNIDRLISIFRFTIRYVTPIVLVIVFLSSVGVLDKILKIFQG